MGFQILGINDKSDDIGTEYFLNDELRQVCFVTVKHLHAYSFANCSGLFVQEVQITSPT